MMNANESRSYQFLTWNVQRGLNDYQKCQNVKNFILSEKPDMVCIQEMKLNSINNTLLKEILGSRLDSEIHILSNGTAGGLILAWKSSIFRKVSHLIQTCYTIMDLKINMDDTIVRVTRSVWTFTSSNRRIFFFFFQEMATTKPHDDIPWMINGDFNQTILLYDRSTTSRQQDMGISQLVHSRGLINLHLYGQRYTWSNKRDQPPFSRLDRFLVSNSWAQRFPNLLQSALASTVSNHCPISCSCTTKFPLPNAFNFENFWLRLPDFKEVVQFTWTQKPVADTPHQLHSKVVMLRKSITKWRRTKVGNLTSQKKVCKTLILWLDWNAEWQQLTQLELLTKWLIKGRLQEIVIQEEQIWRQRAKRTWLEQGDKNTTYFHSIA